jgi:hypothetical protein
MSKIRLQGPENFGGFSHDGESYVADEDGVIEVPPHLPTEVLVAHGLKPAAAKVVKPLAKSAKGGEPDPVEPGPETEARDMKPAQKGAKSAKGGEQ